MSQQYSLFGRHSPFSTPPLSDASGSAPSSPSEHELPVIISVPRSRARLANSRMSNQSAKQAAAAMTEGSSHKGRHLRRGEQLKRNAACAQCRRRRTKCDAAKPHCSACVRHHAYLRKTQPDSYPDDSCVICSYDEETERPVSLRGLGTDTPIAPSSAPNGRRKSMPVLPRAARRTSKQSSHTPSDTQGEPVMNELISRVAELQAELVRQSSSASLSSQPPLASAPLPFSEPTRTVSLPTPYSSPFLPGFNPLSIYMEGLSQTSDTIPPLAVNNDNSPFFSPSPFNGLNGNGNTSVNVNPTISPLPFSGPMSLQNTYELFDTSSWDASAVSTQDVSRGSIDPSQLAAMNYMFSQASNNTTMDGAFSNEPPPIDIPRAQGLTSDNVYAMTQPFLPAPALDDGIQDPTNAMMETWSQAYLESEISRNMLSRHSI